LSPNAQVEVFGEGVGLPASGVFDGRFPPHPRRSVELQKEVAGHAPGLFDGEVYIELQGLQAGDEGVVLVEVLPAGLHHAHPFVAKVGYGAAQEVGLGQKIGVEYGDELAAGTRSGIAKGPGLEALAVGAEDLLDLKAPLSVFGHLAMYDLAGVVGGIIQDVDLKSIRRIIKGGYAIDEPLHDIALVVDGELYRYEGQLLFRLPAGRLLRRGGRRLPIEGGKMQGPGVRLRDPVGPAVVVQEVELHEAVHGNETERRRIHNEYNPGQDRHGGWV